MIADARVIGGPLSSQEFGIGTTISKLQRSGRLPRPHCEGCFRIVCCIYWAGIISITIDSRMSHGHYFKTTGMRRTSSRCSISLHPGHNGRCTDVIVNSEVRMSRNFDTSTTTQMAKIVVQHRRPCGSSWKASVRWSSGRTIVGRAIRESSFEICLGKSSKNWECLFVNGGKGLFLSMYVDDIKTGWQETQH